MMHRSCSQIGAILALAFLPACGGGGDDGPTPPMVGALAIVTSTMGTSLDGDGYRAVVQGGPTLALPANGTTYALALAPGAREVTLADVADNCTVGGGATRSTSVIAGDTVTVAFAVTCVTPEPPRAVQVRVRTSGTQLDPDGYQVRVGAGNPQAIAINGEVVVSGLAAAPEFQGVTLSGVAANCVVMGGLTNQVITPVTGLAGTTFDVVCGATVPGNTIVVQAQTTGDQVDPDGYLVGLTTLDMRTLPVNGSVTIASVASGTRELRYEGIAPNCRWEVPVIVQVTDAAGALVPFIARCNAVPAACRTNAINLQVSAGLTPTISWDSACRVESLNVVDRTAGKLLWTMNGHELTTPVTYGTPPTGADHFSAALPLQPGGDYSVSVQYLEAGTLQLTSALRIFRP